MWEACVQASLARDTLRSRSMPRGYFIGRVVPHIQQLYLEQSHLSLFSAKNATVIAYL